MSGLGIALSIIGFIAFSLFMLNKSMDKVMDKKHIPHS